jgi:hypothetical protein
VLHAASLAMLSALLPPLEIQQWRACPFSEQSNCICYMLRLAGGSLLHTVFAGYVFCYTFYLLKSLARPRAAHA